MRQLWAIFLSLSLATAARLPRPEKPEKPEQLTMEDLANLWVENGGKGSACATAVAVAWTESKGDPGKKGYNSPGTVDRGLWQINDRLDHDGPRAFPAIVKIVRSHFMERSGPAGHEG